MLSVEPSIPFPKSKPQKTKTKEHTGPSVSTPMKCRNEVKNTGMDKVFNIKWN